MTAETQTVDRAPAVREVPVAVAAGMPPESVVWRIVSSAAFAKVTVGVVILLTWQIGMDLFAANYVARPLGIIQAIPVVWDDPRFQKGVVNTLGAICIGVLIALVAGTVVGVLMGRIKTIDRLLNFYVVAFYAMPMVAIVPLLRAWFGPEDATRMSIILFAGFFSIALNMSDGARATPPEYIDVARAYRARPWNVWFGIALPAAMPYLLAGIRLAAGRALVGAVVAEMLVGIPNSLGFFILFEAGNLRHDEAFVAVLVLSLFGVAVELLLNLSTRYFLPWYRREGRAA
ncbi:MAG: ABC transporter permease [Alphaproteobacteria bacterium]|nr:ABC transporter permease [Alphaproteobacteria bacterium]